MLLGAAAPPLGHPPVAMMPYYLHTKMEQLILLFRYTECITMRPVYLGGLTGARGGEHN